MYNKIKDIYKVPIGKKKKKYNHWNALDHIPSDCGYDKKFRYNIDMNSNGIISECIQWCVNNCEGKWGWWFDSWSKQPEWRSSQDEQDAYMSFEKKHEATKFWLAVGVANMGERESIYPL